MATLKKEGKFIQYSNCSIVKIKNKRVIVERLNQNERIGVTFKRLVNEGEKESDTKNFSIIGKVARTQFVLSLDAARYLYAALGEELMRLKSLNKDK